MSCSDDSADSETWGSPHRSPLRTDPESNVSTAELSAGHKALRYLVYRI